MLTLNLIRKLYIPFVLKLAFQKPKSMQETVQQSGVGRIIQKKKKLFKIKYRNEKPS